MSKVLSMLLEVGFLTGSRAFGTAKHDSDYDVVVSVQDNSKVAEIISGIVTKQSDYFNGFKLQDGGIEINIIPVHPHEFLPWYLATVSLRTTLRKSGISRSIQKYSLFMSIVSTFKGLVEERQTNDNYRVFNSYVMGWALEDGLRSIEIDQYNIEPEF